jgi:hypothetical protein
VKKGPGGGGAAARNCIASFEPNDENVDIPRKPAEPIRRPCRALLGGAAGPVHRFRKH